jgi:hypothetical protein
MGWFDLSLESEGLGRMHTLLGVLKKLGTAIEAVELHSIRREESSSENATILMGLAGQGRDFVTQNDSDIAQMEQAFVLEVERRAGALLASLPAKDAAKVLKATGIESREASAMAGAAFIAAMKKWMNQVADRIDRQETNVPPFNGELTSEYAREKARRTGGWIKPIGKLTGQLLENLNASGPAAGKIQLKKGKTSS